MATCFTYQKKSASCDMTLFTSEDFGQEDFMDLWAKIRAFDSLFFSRSNHNHPFAHKESKDESEARIHFHLEQWWVIAAEWDNERACYVSALLANKNKPQYAFVIELKGFQITESIYDEWNVEMGAGDLLSLQECLEGFGATLAKAAPSVVAKPKPESNVPKPVVKPHFEPNKKKKPQELDAPRKKEIHHEDDEEETYVAPTIVKVAFEANSSKKPRNLDAEKHAKPKPIPKKEIEEKPVANADKAVVEPVVVPMPHFAPTSNKKPKNLDVSKARWSARPFLRYRSDYHVSNAHVVVIDWSDEATGLLFEKAREQLQGITSLTVADNCIFSPELPEEGRPWRNEIKNFAVDKWRLLAMDLDAYNAPISYLLAHREQAGLALILSGENIITALSFRGITVAHPYFTFESLLARAEPPVPEPEPETLPEIIVKVEQSLDHPLAQPTEETVVEEVLQTPETVEESHAQTAPRVAHRRVFVTKGYLRDEEAFIDKYHAQAKEDFEGTIIALITMGDDELMAFLRAKHSQDIATEHDVTIRKFRFGSSSEYEASRLFYCRGYDVNRHMDSRDFLLLGLSDQGEHEEQGKIASLLGRMFQTDRDLVLYQKLLPDDETEELDQLAYMSRRQFSYLDEARSSMPMAFLGSAGTGKTLLSLRHYMRLGEEGGNILYLTYQKALCDDVRKKLRELGSSDIEAMTYRDLCFSVFGDEVGRTMRTKRGFRTWFLEYRRRTGSVRNRLKEVGPTAEDQFMICYVFYRGVIDGAKLDYEKRNGRIITRELFFNAVKDEEGLSAKAKDVIYDVALAYEKQLSRDGGTTDNKLAARILSLGKTAKRYDAIVIDEFQDLSQIQFMAVVSLLRDHRPLPLFIYGDEDQAINPTIFNFSDAETILYEMFHARIRFNVQKLNDSYRSGPNLVHYINDVNRLKDDYIGMRDQEQRIETSLREDEEDLFAGLVEGKDSLEKLVRICADSEKEVVFVFPTVLRKEELAERFAPIAKAFTETAFLSVEEAKGREWDSVVLVDFFSSEKKLFEAIIGEERAGHHSTVHRMLFNRFYVALTRAQNRIVVYESDVSPVIRDTLLSGLTRLENLDELSSYFEGHAAITHWKAFGIRLMKAGKYAGAYRAFSRVDDDEARALGELCSRYVQAEKGDLSFEQSRDLYLSQLDYTKLCDLYEEEGKMERARFLRMFSEKDVEPRYLIEAFHALHPQLTSLERNVFFALCADKMAAKIRAGFSSLYNGGDYHG